MEQGVLNIASRAERAIQERVFPGCVVGVVKKSGKREIKNLSVLMNLLRKDVLQKVS